MSEVTISIPTPLRAYTNNQKKIRINADENISSTLEKLIQLFPQLKDHLFDGDRIRNFVNIYVNDDDIRYLEEKEKTKLQNGDVVSIIPAIAGGNFLA